jgi:hypothetical protein
MTIWSRRTLAISALVLSGWAYRHARPEDARAAISKPAAAGIAHPVVVGNLAAAVHETETVHALPREPDWVAQFHAAGSAHFEFVKRAARAAFEGDGAALYYVGRAVARCEETNALYEHADDADEAVAHLSYAPALLERERQEYLDCRRFRAEDPFKSLPERAGGYPASYWHSRAVATGYPVAMVEAALDSRGDGTPYLIATALATGNPEAMLLFGRTQAALTASSGSGSINAAAWVLAACRNGADCSSGNEELGIPTCGSRAEIGCAQGYTAIDELTASLNSQALEQANLLAQDIQASLQQHDPGQLQKYVAL